MKRNIFAVPMLSIALATATLAGGAAIVAPTAAAAKDGCPPGLAKKHNGCRPPGHAWKQEVRREYHRDYRRDRDSYARRDSYRDTYRDGYSEGYREAQRDNYYENRRQGSDLDTAARVLSNILN
ncbi:excinuclease ABC subunit A [Frigidibacter sp. MR17.14]|uniref:excinuclease ABC subunit A n=1 Tax=Frigidibacter sp. MR17.14 TaxID=3126509 RepID=UPI003012B689